VQNLEQRRLAFERLPAVRVANSPTVYVIASDPLRVDVSDSITLPVRVDNSVSDPVPVRGSALHPLDVRLSR
ncbi:MAG: hypothetical protein ABII82_18075, partial [Verrucomicrobiota bacterium]